MLGVDFMVVVVVVVVVVKPLHTEGCEGLTLTCADVCTHHHHGIN
jgi:hypothetical protein